jgi:hypothetical protein
MNEESAPCKGCADRVLHCHSNCTKYKQYKSLVDKHNQQRRAEYEAKNFMFEAKEKVRESYRRRREK